MLEDTNSLDGAQMVFLYGACPVIVQDEEIVWKRRKYNAFISICV